MNTDLGAAINAAHSAVNNAAFRSILDCSVSYPASLSPASRSCRANCFSGPKSELHTRKTQ